MSNVWFNPAPDRLLVVIDDLIDPELSLREVATRHNTSVAALSLWLALPDTTQQLAIFHSAFCDRIRLLAASNVADSVSTIIRLLDRFRESDAAPDPTLTPEQRQRAREFALRAATLLVRLANYRPTALGTPPREPRIRDVQPNPNVETAPAQHSRENAQTQAARPSSPTPDAPAAPLADPILPSALPHAKPAEQAIEQSRIPSSPHARQPSTSDSSDPVPPPTPAFLHTSDEDESLLATPGPAIHEHWP